MTKPALSPEKAETSLRNESSVHGCNWRLAGMAGKLAQFLIWRVVFSPWKF